MNHTWLRAAWVNRERIVAAVRKLKLPWVGLAMLAVIVYWVAARSGVELTSPSQWPLASWIIVGIHIVGWAMMYALELVRFRREDEVWDEVDILRGQVDELRVALHERAQPDGPMAEVLPAVDRIATEEIPQVGTVERQLGGRTFSFRA